MPSPARGLCALLFYKPKVTFQVPVSDPSVCRPLWIRVGHILKSRVFPLTGIQAGSITKCVGGCLIYQE